MSAREPTRDQLLAMAYADGELDGNERVEFEQRLSSEPALLAEVTELKRLGVLARRMTPVEPKDFEWQRLNAEALHSGGTSLGLALSAIGALGVLGWLCYSLLASDLGVVPKAFFCALLGGLTLVFLLVFRARLRTLPYDPYTEVDR